MSSRIPTSTYRLQLHAGYGFRAAARIVPYLHRLGISDVYLSPILKAAPGSTHGYDVLDHDVINPELGGVEAFEELCQALKAHDLGLIVDFVPNHMGVGCDGNHLWEDVLEHGQSSERADYFDIDWQPPKETLHKKLLLPILPDRYGVSLERGYFALRLDAGIIRLKSGDRVLPLRPSSLGSVLRRVADLLEGRIAQTKADELRELARAHSELVEGDPAEPESTADYRSSARGLQHRLRELISTAELGEPFEQALSGLSGSPSEPQSFDFLDEVLRAQHYRLSDWHLAMEAVNYRRFFDVTELASLRVEHPAVFDSSHRLLSSLVEQGKITGIRLDHIDGLHDPIAYLRRLDEKLHEALPNSEPSEPPLYVLVEKILAPGEVLPSSFRAHGTTGYELARVVSGVLVDRRAESSLTSTYRHYTGDLKSFDEHVRQAKRDVLASLLASDASFLSRALERVAEQDRRWRDLTWSSLHSALVEVMATFGAYRSYVRPDGTRAPEDEALINRAVADALRNNPTSNRGPYQFLRSVLLMESDLPGARELALRFQQTTGPVTAKALEDTAFYRYPRNLMDNEVGNRPDGIGVELREFHAHLATTQREHPSTLGATSTHDTKRGEDARARLSVLSELPNTWRHTVHDLQRLSAKHRSVVDGSEAPARTDQYLFFQALVGAVPFGARESDVAELGTRMAEYALKASREAKTHTSWLQNDTEYEAALDRFARETVQDSDFARRLLRFCRRIEPISASKAIGQIALKMCAPGVPDTYQGSELWHQVLVDPDNRRPVDYERLESDLDWLDARRGSRPALIAELLEHVSDGRLKLFVVSELLRLRREAPSRFRGEYHALDAGPSCIAFARGAERDVLCLVPRFPFRLTRGRRPWAVGAAWGEQRIIDPTLGGVYRNVFSGESVTAEGSLELSAVFAHLPVAVLVRS